ncbi:zinc C3HC4 type RING finger domain-containing protein [Babesia ovata]|uniref:Zinc C3HC4 type RING finger domain-containing protein n=1 Tax=Babesia ovata TaxID=189622 RepID=A0A2H6KCN9_9APIC|nr:zinc C3HC4 type RING finger domain-containing protein [Babesia ovata]GBE60761.1 zinc C3HC4 type RING finger domain-containing protein [Babesia ovata]
MSRANSIDEYVGVPVERHSTMTLSPRDDMDLFDHVPHDWDDGQCPCLNRARRHAYCESCHLNSLIGPGHDCHSAPVTRYGSAPAQQALVHRRSMPPDSNWNMIPPMRHQTSLTDPRGFGNVHHTRAQTTGFGGPMPHLTRTQRSYINANPPSTREALTLRFMKANMARFPSNDTGSHYSRSDSIPFGGPQLTRNRSAPVTGVLSRTTSIQPPLSTPSSSITRHRTSMHPTSRRQISEPVNLQGMGPEPTLASMQRDIEALNRVLHDFQQNFTITPAVTHETRDGRPLVRRQSERVTEVHALYDGVENALNQMQYDPHAVPVARTPRGIMDDEQINLMNPDQMLQDVQEYEDSVPTPVGLADEIISQFPVAKFDAVAAERWDEDTRRCAICLEAYEQDQRIRRLPCTHGYHKVCVDEWLGRSTICPICKFDYRIMMT